jgi:hypothetical protein
VRGRTHDSRLWATYRGAVRPDLPRRAVHRQLGNPQLTCPFTPGVGPCCRTATLSAPSSTSGCRTRVSASIPRGLAGDFEHLTQLTQCIPKATRSPAPCGNRRWRNRCLFRRLVAWRRASWTSCEHRFPPFALGALGRRAAARSWRVGPERLFSRARALRRSPARPLPIPRHPPRQPARPLPIRRRPPRQPALPLPIPRRPPRQPALPLPIP